MGRNSRVALAIAVLIGMMGSAAAQERGLLGYGHLFNNDGLAAAQDRWRTGSYQISVLHGREWQGSLPEGIGQVLEFRLRAEIIAPSNLARPVPLNDRRYVGILAPGVHTHFGFLGTEVSLGADLVITGPQTGLDDFQDFTHELFGATNPRADRTQIGNSFYPTARAEVGREFRIAGRTNLRVRPFVEAQAGAETFARVGADITFGRFGLGGLRLRDPVSGQRFSGIQDEGGAGLSLLVGGDVAYVHDSRFLSRSPAVEKRDVRERLRGGLQLDWGFGSMFYGITWLGREFEGQPEGQLVGSLNLHLSF
ncbi:MAG: DUF2219 domain-containing protein [Alphaproteobacteria bacterium HGW-Alphaproteobacteria-2]|nr:MAG: DUF2219 domain-containing protein [Alphaproteobacteria bacterium HGW-Alphaproteobacteria-2]